MFWGPHAPVEGVQRLRDLLTREVEVPPRLRARALRNLGGSAHQLRDFELADPSYEESLRIFTELGDRRGIASVRTRLAYRANGEGEPDLARALLEDSQRDAEGRFPLIETQNVVLLAHLAIGDNRLDEADALLDRSYELASGLSWSWYEAIICSVRLDIAFRRGQLDEAERLGRAALAIAVRDEYGLVAVNAIVGLARVALAKSELETAGLFWGASRSKVSTGPESAIRWREELRNETRPAFLAAVARGLELELRDAAAIALGVPPAPRPSS